MVVKTGPQAYEVYDGTVTSCQLPRPGLAAVRGQVRVDSEKAKAQNSVFRLMNMPLLYLPYVTHPVDPRHAAERDSDSGDRGFVDQGLDARRADLLGDQPKHGYDGGRAVLLAARMGAVGERFDIAGWGMTL